MRNLSRGEGPNTRRRERAGQKRKYESSERQSVQSAAKEFLEKATRELLGGNNGGIKGPLQIDNDNISEDEDDELPVQ